MKIESQLQNINTAFEFSLKLDLDALGVVEKQINDSNSFTFGQKKLVAHAFDMYRRSLRDQLSAPISP